MLRDPVWQLCALIAGWAILAPPATGTGQNDGKPPAPSSGEIQCAVVLLEHADCELTADHIRVLFQGKTYPRMIVGYRPVNAVLMRGTPEKIEQMKYLISQIDMTEQAVEATEPPPRRLKIIAVRHAQAETLLNVLKSTMDEPRRARPGRRRSSSHPQFAVDQRTNVIVVLGTEDQITRAAELVEALDVPIEPPKTNVGQ